MNTPIYEKINKIKDLEDRALLKKIIGSVFTSLEEYTKKQYSHIEKRVFDEISIDIEKYNVFCTICNKHDIDPISEFLFPIINEDIEEEVHDISKIINSLKNKEPIFMFKVFLKCDYITCKNILNEGKNFKGIIQTNKKVHQAYFKLVKNTDYLEKIEKLYQSFINNNVRWKTINNPYIHKIANVILVEELDEIELDEVIDKIEVDFGEYAKYIEYNMVPLWNIQELELKTTGFQIPCKDRINYEHTISIAKEGIENGYLVDYIDNDVNNVVHKEESLVISSPNADKSIWNLWKFIRSKNEDKNTNNYPIISNEYIVNFSNKLSAQNGFTIKSRTELAKMMNSYVISKDIEFVDFKLENVNIKGIKETYQMNEFILDEIRDGNKKRTLILYFSTKDKDNYLNRDILSFLVSEVQLLYPEYECEGRLI